VREMKGANPPGTEVTEVIDQAIELEIMIAMLSRGTVTETED
jgi:hypothetical protein